MIKVFFIIFTQRADRGSFQTSLPEVFGSEDTSVHYIPAKEVHFRDGLHIPNKLPLDRIRGYIRNSKQRSIAFSRGVSSRLFPPSSFVTRLLTERGFSLQQMGKSLYFFFKPGRMAT